MGEPVTKYAPTYPGDVLTLTAGDDFLEYPGGVLIYAADGYAAEERCYHNRPTGEWCEACGSDNAVVVSPVVDDSPAALIARLTAGDTGRE